MTSGVRPRVRRWCSRGSAEKERSVRGGDRRKAMGKIGDVAFKTFTAGLGVCTLYLVTIFSYNVYQGLSWHSAQSEMQKKGLQEREE